MTRLLHRFEQLIQIDRGAAYAATAYGNERLDGTWEGWLVFVPVSPRGEPLRTERETTQPNLPALEYWATGLSQVYLEGALSRARSGVALGPASARR